MNTLADKAITLWRSERFRNWVMVLLGTHARTIYGEPVTTPERIARRELARAVLVNPAGHVDIFANALVGDTEVAELGGIPEASWNDAHLVILHAKVAGLWSPIALDRMTS